MVEHPVRISNSSGDTMGGDLRYEEGRAPLPVIIVCHGFTAHKDWGPFPHVGRKFASLGFASIVFNFSHNGIGRDFKRFTELDRFSRNTIGKELEDVRAVVEAVQAGKVGGRVCDGSRIGIVGHSRGGGVAILAASYDSRLRAVAGWSTVGTFYRYTPHQQKVWKEQGFLPVKIRSVATRLRYGIEVLDDLESNRERYDLHAAVERLEVPLLLIHGREDVAVRASEAERLYDCSDKSKSSLILLDHVGHMYGAHARFAHTHETLEHIIQITADWFHRHL